MLSESQNLNNMSSGVFSMFRTVDLVFIACDIVLVSLAFYFRNNYRTFPTIKGAFRVIAIFSI